MRTLEDLQKEYGYAILTPDEVRAIREGKVVWGGLDGEIIIRKCLKSYPAYLQAVNYGYNMTAYHYSLSANLQKNFEKGPNIDPNTGKRLPYGLILLSAPPQTGKSYTAGRLSKAQCSSLCQSFRENNFAIHPDSVF